MLYGKCREVRVSRQIAGGTGFGEQSEEYFSVPVSWMDQDRLWPRKP